LFALSSCALAASCSAQLDTEPGAATSGESIGTNTSALTGCHGHASSTIPTDNTYVMTTFGGGSDSGTMSCGGYADGTGWYAASRQRYGCGAKLQVTATNGNCVVVSALDYGPDECVEAAAHSPILDMSPHAANALYGVHGAGWSDHIKVQVVEVDASTPVGACADPSQGGSGSGSGSGGTSGGATTCSSATLGRDVDDGECVQSASDQNWYQCSGGAWVAIGSTSSCTTTYAWCYSSTLGQDVPPLTCVQSASDSQWYQCNGSGWVTPVDEASESGPLGACASWNPL